MTDVKKPIPIPPEDDLPYWEGALQHKLVLPKCSACGLLSRRFEMVCHRCQNETFEWTELSGRGTIYTYSVARQSTTNGFEDDLPYVIVQVSIEEQPELSLITNLVGEFDLDQLDIGLPVLVEFEQRAGVSIPQFRLA